MVRIKKLISLEETTINDVEKILKEYGGSFSGLIENLLGKWVKEKEKESAILDLYSESFVHDTDLVGKNYQELSKKLKPVDIEKQIERFKGKPKIQKVFQRIKEKRGEKAKNKK